MPVDMVRNVRAWCVPVRVHACLRKPDRPGASDQRMCEKNGGACASTRCALCRHRDHVARLCVQRGQQRRLHGRKPPHQYHQYSHHYGLFIYVSSVGLGGSGCYCGCSQVLVKALRSRLVGITSWYILLLFVSVRRCVSKPLSLLDITSW